MISRFILFSRFCRSKDGAVTVQAALLTTLFIGFIGSSIEIAYAYWQYNAVQHAARMGVRIAATTDPVADSLTTMTGLSTEVAAGDPLPDYSITCTGSLLKCSEGSFNEEAFGRIVYGKNNDGLCSATGRETRGMCDYISDIKETNVSVTYQHSGFDTAGNPADVIPLISVKVSGLRFNFLFLDIVTTDRFQTMPDISVTAMSEDLQTGGR